MYFTQGHGEKDTASAERPGYNAAAAAMTGDNFVLDTLVLAQKDVPADAAILIIAGPKSDFLPSETDKLRPTSPRGGKLLVMLDPPASAQEPPRTNLVSLLRAWDIDVGANVVIDMSGMGEIDRHRRDGADRGEVSDASDHGAVRRADGVSVRVFGDADSEGHQRALRRADGRRDEQEQLGRNRCQESHRRATRRAG